jgi:hypothetical protein
MSQIDNRILLRKLETPPATQAQLFVNVDKDSGELSFPSKRSKIIVSDTPEEPGKAPLKALPSYKEDPKYYEDRGFRKGEFAKPQLDSLLTKEQQLRLKRAVIQVWVRSSNHYEAAGISGGTAVAIRTPKELEHYFQDGEYAGLCIGHIGNGDVSAGYVFIRMLGESGLVHHMKAEVLTFGTASDRDFAILKFRPSFEPVTLEISKKPVFAHNKPLINVRYHPNEYSPSLKINLAMQHVNVEQSDRSYLVTHEVAIPGDSGSPLVNPETFLVEVLISNSALTLEKVNGRERMTIFETPYRLGYGLADEEIVGENVISNNSCAFLAKDILADCIESLRRE